MFSIETAIVDEIVRYNKVDCPFTLSSDTKEALKVTVDRSFKDVYNLPILWRLHKTAFSTTDFPAYQFQIFSFKRLSWENCCRRLVDISEWQEYMKNNLTLGFNRGAIQYDTLISNAKEFLKREEGCVIYDATTTPERRAKE